MSGNLDSPTDQIYERLGSFWNDTFLQKDIARLFVGCATEAGMVNERVDGKLGQLTADQLQADAHRGFVVRFKPADIIRGDLT